MYGIFKKIKYIEKLLPDYIKIEDAYQNAKLLGKNISELVEQGKEYNKKEIKNYIKSLLESNSDLLAEEKQAYEKREEESKKSHKIYDVIKIAYIRGEV